MPTVAYVRPPPCQLLAQPGGFCAKVNQRLQREARADDIDIITVQVGVWGRNTQRVVCVGCGGFVRWGKKERTPEEVIAARESTREYRRAYYEKMDWKVKYEDRRAPGDGPPGVLEDAPSCISDAQYDGFQDVRQGHCHRHR